MKQKILNRRLHNSIHCIGWEREKDEERQREREREREKKSESQLEIEEKLINMWILINIEGEAKLEREA